MVDTARQLLDELMGRNRNLDPTTAKEKKVQWDDPEVRARHFYLGYKIIITDSRRFCSQNNNLRLFCHLNYRLKAIWLTNAHFNTLSFLSNPATHKQRTTKKLIKPRFSPISPVLFIFPSEILSARSICEYKSRFGPMQ